MKLLMTAALLLLAGPTLAGTGVADSAVFALNTAELTGVVEGGQLPAAHHLAPCYPNPFNPSTTIEYYLASPGKVQLAIYDLKGRLVRSLVSSEELTAGAHESVWRGRNDAGHSVAGGVYLCRLRIGSLTLNQRMTLLK